MGEIKSFGVLRLRTSQKREVLRSGWRIVEDKFVGKGAKKARLK
jgi:hypothetical protein